MNLRVLIGPEEQFRRDRERRSAHHYVELRRLRALAGSLEALCRDAPAELDRVRRRIAELELEGE